MSLICTLSNETPESAVISPLSGCIFERRLIEKYIGENGTDPVSGEVLTVDQLITLKVPKLNKPRPSNFSSIPSILKCQQDEWDALMLHTYSLRHQLNSTRQELSHALYQHDAACRVIARLTKELTAVREALAILKPQTVGVSQIDINDYVNKSKMEDTIQESIRNLTDDVCDVVGLSETLMSEIQKNSKLLTAERKKRGKKIPENICSVDSMKAFNQIDSNSGLHSTSVPGITGIDVCPSNDKMVVTCGNDKNIVVYDQSEKSIVTNLKGHTKKVNQVVYHKNGNNVISVSDDMRLRVWDIANASSLFTMKAHDGAVTGVSLHAMGNHTISCSEDGSWTFTDINEGKLISKSSENSRKNDLLSCQFHPDGMIFGTGGRNSIIDIWDLNQNESVAYFDGNEDGIVSLAFSENGYYFASASKNGVLKLWDLRKLKNFKTICLNQDKDFTIQDVCFDNSGCYLAVAGTNVQVYLSKQWECLNVFEKHTDIVTGVKFGQDAKSLYSVSLDRTVLLYGDNQNSMDVE